MTDGKKTCFIAMPVRTTPKHAEVYDDPEHWKHVMEWLFVPAVEAAGFEPWLPVAKGSHLIHAQIVQQLEQADMVLCDMSENNPNVFFELGVRTSVNKPIALVRCDPNTPIPFDVSGINTYTYNPALRPWNNGEQVTALAEHIREADETCAGTNPLWSQFGLTLKATEPTSVESKEQALLEVVSRQVTELKGEFTQFRQRADGTATFASSRGDSSYTHRIFIDDNGQSHYLPLGRDSILTIFQEEVARTADAFGIDAVVDEVEDGIVIVSVSEGTADRSYEHFMDHLSSFALRLDLKIVFRRRGSSGGLHLSAKG